MTTKSLVQKLENDIIEIENIKKKRVLYNTRNLAIRSLLKTGAYVANFAAFFLSTTITLNILSYNNMDPFIKNEWEKPLHVYEERSSLEEHQILHSYDEKYDMLSLAFYKGWTQNEQGLYEREEIYFQAGKDILENFDVFLNMSLEELQNEFRIIDVKTFSKPVLENDDLKYTEDKVVVGYSYDDYEKAKVVDEPSWLIGLSMFLFFAFGAVGGFINIEIEDFFFKNNWKKTMERLEVQYAHINEDDIAKLESKIALMKQNLALLKEETVKSSEEPYIKVKKVRESKGGVR